MRNRKIESRLAGCFGLLLALCFLTPVLPSAAQPPPQKENRFLFIINTSAAMKRETNGVRQAVVDLLQSGMNGEMRDGDTFGLWTYDDQLRTDFPMQIWSKRNQDQIVAGVTGYLGGLRWQNRPHLEKVLPAMSQILANSRVITLIFIYDGTETMQGSGFDKDINDLQRQFGPQMRGQNLPFVTLLAAWNGKTIDYSVNPPGKISVPQTADLARPPVTNAAPAAVASAPAAPPAVVPKPPEPRHREIILTNTPAVADAAPTAPKPAEAAAAPAQPPAAAVAAAGVEEAPKPQPPTAPAPVADQPPASPPGSVAANRTDLTDRTDLASVALPPVRAGTVAPSVAAQTQRGGALASAAVPGAVEAAPLQTTHSLSPVTSASSATSVPAAPVQVAPPTAATPPPVQALRPASVPAPPVAQTAVVMPPAGGHIPLVVMAVALLTIAVVLIVLLVRRSRASPSLISQSLDGRR